MRDQGALEAAAPTWVGRSGGSSRDKWQRCHPGGSVGRAFRPKICFAALRAAGRSIGGTESETPSTDFVSRSLETQSLLSTSLRPTRALRPSGRSAPRRSRPAIRSDAQKSERAGREEAADAPGDAGAAETGRPKSRAGAAPLAREGRGKWRCASAHLCFWLRDECEKVQPPDSPASTGHVTSRYLCGFTDWATRGGVGGNRARRGPPGPVLSLPWGGGSNNDDNIWRHFRGLDDYAAVVVMFLFVPPSPGPALP